MKKAPKSKTGTRRRKPLALPPGVVVHRGPVKHLRRWMVMPEMEGTGGCRSSRGNAVEDFVKR